MEKVKIKPYKNGLNNAKYNAHIARTNDILLRQKLAVKLFTIK